MHKAMYRLGEYLVTEFENGQLQWEAHAALGMQRSGKCFILDNILIIGRCREEDHGYLKLEFHEQLRKLPVWNKSRYYCFAFNLLDVVTGQIVTEDFLQEVTTLSQMKGAAENAITDIKHGTFRLGQYRINVTVYGNISWQSVEGINKVIGGPCRIESSVLFICLQEYVKENQNKHDFLNKLQQLPQWDNTTTWCRSMVLQDCRPQQQTMHCQAAVTTENISQNFLRNGKPTGNFKEQRREAITKTRLSSGYKRLSTLWHRILLGKALFITAVSKYFKSRYSRNPESLRESGILLKTTKDSRHSESPPHSGGSAEEMKMTGQAGMTNRDKFHLFNWRSNKNLMPAALGAIVLLLGLTMIFYSVGRGCHVSHWDDDQHHKHDHEED